MTQDPVPKDIVRLSRLTFRYRKLLWIFGVPCFAMCLFSIEGRPWFGIPGTLLGLAICIFAATHRSPRRDPGIRLLLEHPEAVDRILVCDAPAMAQIVLYRGQEGLAFLDIEDNGKFGEALDVVTAHLPGVPVDYRPPTDERFVYRKGLKTFIQRF
jgi:hypothetical protein